MGDIAMVVRGSVGHRGHFIAFFQAIFMRSGHAVTVGALSIRHVMTKAVLFSPMFEEHPLKFVIVATLRAALGRRSVALLFRPREVFASSAPKHVVKKFFLSVIRKFPKVCVLTILPFEIDHRFGSIARGWIYDPQLWDADEMMAVADKDLVDHIGRLASGRHVVAALGGQSFDKGFEYFAQIWSSNAILRENMLFVAAGVVEESSQLAASAFAAQGGLLIDRYISDAELSALYSAADAVWACYAPTYDQASGIFGRAVQSKVRAILRKGSALELVAQQVRAEPIAIDWEAPRAATHVLLQAMRTGGQSQTTTPEKLRHCSLETLSFALDLPLSTSK